MRLLVSMVSRVAPISRIYFGVQRERDLRVSELESRRLRPQCGDSKHPQWSRVYEAGDRIVPAVSILQYQDDLEELQRESSDIGYGKALIDTLSFVSPTRGHYSRCFLRQSTRRHPDDCIDAVLSQGRWQERSSHIQRLHEPREYP